MLTSPSNRVARYRKLASVSVMLDVEPPRVIVVFKVVVLSPMIMMAKSC